MEEERVRAGESANAPPLKVRFGPFELDLRARELRKAGRRIRLQEQPFQILRMLLESPGEVVPREDIRNRLWPEGRVVEFDHSINAAVMRLRDALRDSAEKPRYIETLARIGYRFIGRVEVDDAFKRSEPVIVMPARDQEHLPRHQHQDVQPGDNRPISRNSVARPLGIALLLFAGTGIWLLSRTSPQRQPLAAVPLTSYPGQEVEPSFSPDGKQVAFSWNGANQDNFDIYTKQIGNDNPVRLTTDSRRDFSPAWSPDGQTIAFGRILNAASSAIYLVPAGGGPERKIVECAPPAAFRPGPFLAWSPDGKWLAYSDVPVGGAPLAPTGSRSVSLFLISVETLEKRALTSPPPNFVGDTGPAFAPDAHALAFIRTRTLAVSKLYWLPISRTLIPSGEPRPLTSGTLWTSSPSWSPDGEESSLPPDRGVALSYGGLPKEEQWRLNGSRCPTDTRMNRSPHGVGSWHIRKGRRT